MEQSRPFRIAVVGANAASAALIESMIEVSGATCSWFQSEADLNHVDRYRWVVAPRWAKTAPERQVVNHAMVFVGGHRRVPLSSFLSDVSPLHPALRRRVLALGLWNDLSPQLWRDPEPNFDWVSESPLSFQEPEPLACAVIPWRKCLELWVERLQKKGVTVHHGSECVVQLQLPDVRQDPVGLIKNAPHGVSAAEFVLWNSALGPREKQGADLFSKDLSHKALASWRSYGALVDRALVTGLPPFSLWLDPRFLESFRETGEIKSGLLKRVFLLAPGNSEKSWLQIDDFCLQGAPRDPSRIDAFLWKLCPYLRQAVIPFSEDSFEENFVFSEPRPLWRAYHRAIAQNVPSSLEAAPQRSLEAWLRQPKIDIAQVPNEPLKG